MLRRTYRRRPRRRKPYRRSLLRLRRIKRRPKRIRKKTRIVYAKKRPWRRRKRWKYRPAPIIRVVHANEPTTVTAANGSGSLKGNAQEALRQRGLWRGIWRQRLRYPPSRLARFINRFYRIPGFEYVVQDYYGRPYQQQRAKRAIQLTHRLANDNSNYLRRLLINRIVRLNRNGQPRNTISLQLGAARYQL